MTTSASFDNVPLPPSLHLVGDGEVVPAPSIPSTPTLVTPAASNPVSRTASHEQLRSAAASILASDGPVEEDEEEENESQVQDRQTASKRSITKILPFTSAITKPRQRSTVGGRSGSFALHELGNALRGDGARVGEPVGQLSQSRPLMLPTPLSEIAFILICSAGQFFFSSLLGNMTVLQRVLIESLGMPNTQAPWLNGSYLLANGLSVVLSGALADLFGARKLICASLGWLCAWCIIGASTAHLRSVGAFLLVRAMQGLAVGGLTSASISYLGRVYKPGLRKNRVFSVMASLAPFGFVLGGIQGGALAHRIDVLFGSNAVLAGAALMAAIVYAPSEARMRQHESASASAAAAVHAARKFDYIGATLAVGACGLLLFGLTQGSSAHWSPYTYGSVLGGLACLVAFVVAESRVAHPLIPNSLWKIKGFVPLSLSYFLSFGSFSAWQFYAVAFWIRVQSASPLRAALYLLPNAFVGVLATFLVARTSHLISGHLILGIGCLASAIGPAFFFTQGPDTPYWALSMPAIALSTFAPDLSFAAASIFITSNVSRSYQGCAGSVLITLQNLSSAIMTSLGETVGAIVAEKQWGVASVPAALASFPASAHVGQLANATADSFVNPLVNPAGGPGLPLETFHAIWWMDLAGGLLALAIALVALRIPKAEEREHLA